MQDYSTYEILPTGRQSTISFYRSPDGAIRLGPIQSQEAQRLTPPPAPVLRQQQPMERRARPQSTFVETTAVAIRQDPVNLFRSESLAILDAPVNGLTAQTTQGLQVSVSKYMQDQENHLNSMKATMEEMKQLEREMEDSMEKLQESHKKAQEALSKKMQADTKQLRGAIDARKKMLQERMENLSELNQEAQKKYFESQEKALQNYKKTMKKVME